MNLYTETDRQLHFLSQIITKANRTFVPRKEDDSHTNLFFDPLGNRITGRWINAKTNKILFALNFETQAVEIIDETCKRQASITTINKHIEEIEQKIENRLPDFGLNPEGFDAPLHFEIPSYDFAKEPIAKIEPVGMSQWKQFRQLANQACFELMGYIQSWAEVRIWPHHFDTGVYIVPIENKLGIGFGLAMEDSIAESAYFYLAGYPLKGEINYKDLPQSDSWQWKIHENWKGAALTLKTLSNLNQTEQRNIIRRYIVKNSNWFLDHKN